MKKTLLLALFFFIGSANASVFRTTDPLAPTKTKSSWSFGTIFTVGADDVNITSLGAYDDEGNGFLSDAIKIAIFDESNNTILASAEITSSDNLIDSYRYVAIDALLLTSRSTYRLVGVSGDDHYNDYESIFDPAFMINGFGYCSATELTSCDDFAEDDYAMSNFQYEVAPVPAPAAIFLLGSALIGLTGMRKKQVQI